MKIFETQQAAEVWVGRNAAGNVSVLAQPHKQSGESYEVPWTFTGTDLYGPWVWTEMFACRASRAVALARAEARWAAEAAAVDPLAGEPRMANGETC